MAINSYSQLKVLKYLTRIVAALLLTVCATTTYGQWKFIGDNPDTTVRFFIDTSRIYQYDERVWVWFLMDYKEIQTNDWGSYHSMEVLEAINCGTREETFFDYIYYAEPEGRGAVIESDTFGGGGPYAARPESFSELLVATACDEFVRIYKSKAIQPASIRRSPIQIDG